jgi:hypothetical protein
VVPYDTLPEERHWSWYAMTRASEERHNSFCPIQKQYRDVHAEERFLWNVGLGMQTAGCRADCWGLCGV